MTNLDENKYPLVSCITTTYNQFTYVYQTLDSIFSQDYPNIELVLSDDGSDEFPEQELIEYVNTHKKENIRNVVYNFHEENYGTVKNSNINRSLASGKYYIGMGSDDYLHDEKVVSDIVNYFEETGAKIITCQRLLFSTDEKYSYGCMPFSREEKYFEKLSTLQQFRKLSSFMYISGSCTYLSADFFKEIGGLDERYRYFEDSPLYLKLLREGIKIAYYKRIAVCYRFGSGQSTAPNKSNPYKTAIYNERITSIETELIPYFSQLEWWRRKQIKARLKGYIIERDGLCKSILTKYLKMSLTSLIGTVICIYYQLYYKHNIQKNKNDYMRTI